MSEEPPKRWPLVTNPGNRFFDPTKDGRLVNAFAEKDPQFNEYDVIRRPGVQPNSSLTTMADSGRGIFNWRPDAATSYLMQVRQAAGVATLYKDTAAIDTVEVSDIPYDWEPVASATPSLFFKTGGKAFIYDDSAVTPVNDANWLSFADYVLPGLASLNGRLYALAAPNRVYGATNLNDGSAWSTTNLILANDNPDWGTYICRYLQYILVMKTSTTEVFQDVGNPTGSPLGKVEGVSIPYGCVHTECVVRINDDLFWPAKSRNTAQDTEMTQVVRMSGLTPQVISTPEIDRILSSTTPSSAYCLLLTGHKFYCLECLQADGNRITLVFDLTEGLWYEWYMPTRILAASGGPYNFVLQPYEGQPLQIGSLITHDQTVNTDPVLPISMDIFTPNMDFGLDYIKTCNMLYFTGDQTNGTILQIRRSDDDYKSWSNWRRVDLSKKKPRIADEGAFYRRAYHLRFNQVGPIRLRSMGLSLDLGLM